MVKYKEIEPQERNGIEMAGNGKALGERVLGNIAKVIVGKEQTTKLLLTALLADGHVLLEDVPGTGKTKLAKTLAKTIAGEFSRIQFTPDLLPSDITGINFFDSKQNEFVLRKGPVFTNILLADEINRATPRTQAGLLECMEERQVTIDGEAYLPGKPFFVIATQNPVETAGTFPLPEAQMDRFMMRLSIGYPDREQEIRMASQALEGRTPDQAETVCSPAEVMKVMEAVRGIAVREPLLGYMEDMVALTRQESRFVLGASPRAMLALMRASQGRAFLQGRDYVKPDDVKAVAMQVLLHRLTLSPEARIQKADGAGVLKSLILRAKVPV